MVRYWWNMLNCAVFYSTVHQPRVITIQNFETEYAWAIPTFDEGHVNISICPNLESRELFLAILVHEMVHAWEHQNFTTMGHGKRFFAWQGRIKRTTGLTLEKALD